MENEKLGDPVAVWNKLVVEAEWGSFLSDVNEFEQEKYLNVYSWWSSFDFTQVLVVFVSSLALMLDLDIYNELSIYRLIILLFYLSCKFVTTLVVLGRFYILVQVFRLKFLFEVWYFLFFEESLTNFILLVC